MQRVIDILQDGERRAGRPVPEIGPALNFQAQLLTETNQLTEAEAAYRRALALDEKNYGNRSEQVVKDLTGLAQVLEVLQRPEEARSMSRRADEIRASNKGSTRAPNTGQAQRCSSDTCTINAEDGI